MMPWTFAHPAAVLPLRRWCPRWLHFPALVVGSLTPDFGYYLHWLELSRIAHRFPEGLPTCVITGLILVVMFYGLRRPLCLLLPRPHRSALLPLACRSSTRTLSTFLSITLSLALGAVTHMAWDGLTHKGGWMVERLFYLQEPVFGLWGYRIPAYQLLQQLSTLIGVTALAVAYRGWLRRGNFQHDAGDEPSGDRWRYALCGIAAGLATLCAYGIAAHAATSANGEFLFNVFVFRFVVDSTVVFAVIYLASAWVCSKRRGAD